MKKNVFIGTAAWNIPRDFKDLFPDEGSHLERYAQRLNAVEINTSFYRQHKKSVYEKWAAAVPPDFRFSVKLFKGITHEQRLREGEITVKDVVAPIEGLGKKLGCLLVQLPGSLSFEKKEAKKFFKSLRDVYEGPVAFEPRHISWNSEEAGLLRMVYNISDVIADPDPSKKEDLVNPESELIYFRLHGSPQIYKSSYDSDALKSYEKQMKKYLKMKKAVWCIFDNTQYGFAAKNALYLQQSFK